jgi:hypothetical protein
MKEVFRMKLSKALAVFAAIVLAASAPARTLATVVDAATSATKTTGNAPVSTAAPAFSPDIAYSLQDMLTYALLSEYATEAAYAADMHKYGDQSPFTELQAATDLRIKLLKTLFENLGLALPVNTAAEGLAAPSSLQEEYRARAVAETQKIQMYQVFLTQALPDDVRAAFESLLSGSTDALGILDNLIVAGAPEGNGGKKDDDDEKDDEEGGDD